VPTTQHRPHGAFAGPLFGALDGKTDAPPPPAAERKTQHRPHGAFAGPLYGTLSGKAGAGGSAPAAPTTVAGTPTGSTTATTTWAHSGGGETGFTVQHAPTSTGVYVDSTGATNPTAAGVYTYAHTGLTAATPYTSRVKANGSPDSAWAVSATWVTDNPGTGGGTIPTTYTAITSLAAALAVARSASTSASAAIQAARSSSASVAVALQAQRTASAALAAYLTAGGTSMSALLAAAIQARQAATASMAAALQAPRSSSASVAAALATTATATASLQAQLAIWRSATASLSVMVDGPTEAPMQASAPPSGRRIQTSTRPPQRSRTR
jgi:hypothetical protein